MTESARRRSAGRFRFYSVCFSRKRTHPGCVPTAIDLEPSNYLGKERGGGGGCDADADEVAGAACAGREDGDFVLGCTAEELAGVALRDTLDEHLELAADVATVAFERELVL